MKLIVFYSNFVLIDQFVFYLGNFWGLNKLYLLCEHIQNNSLIISQIQSSQSVYLRRHNANFVWIIKTTIARCCFWERLSQNCTMDKIMWGCMHDTTAILYHELHRTLGPWFLKVLESNTVWLFTKHYFHNWKLLVGW